MSSGFSAQSPMAASSPSSGMGSSAINWAKPSSQATPDPFGTGSDFSSAFGAQQSQPAQNFGGSDPFGASSDFSAAFDSPTQPVSQSAAAFGAWNTQPNLKKFIANYNFEARNNDELSFSEGDVLQIDLNAKVEPEWYYGTSIATGKGGLFPQVILMYFCLYQKKLFNKIKKNYF